jgi:hypothetical protein
MTAAAYDSATLLAAAAASLAERGAAYPALVRDGKMTQDQADTGLRISRAIVADWQRIADLHAGREAAPRDTTATTAEKVATLDYVHARAYGQYERARDAMYAALGAFCRAAIEQDIMTMPVLYDAWKKREKGYDREEIGLYFSAKKRCAVAGTLASLAGDITRIMARAEAQAELIARERQAKAA